jgi:hypothetical protein
MERINILVELNTKVLTFLFGSPSSFFSSSPSSWYLCNNNKPNTNSRHAWKHNKKWTNVLEQLIPFTQGTYINCILFPSPSLIVILAAQKFQTTVPLPTQQKKKIYHHEQTFMITLPTQTDQYLQNANYITKKLEPNKKLKLMIREQLWTPLQVPKPITKK